MGDLGLSLTMATQPNPKASNKAPVNDPKNADRTEKVDAKVNAQRIDETGLTSRVRGHVSARTRRTQGKRDSK